MRLTPACSLSELPILFRALTCRISTDNVFCVGPNLLFLPMLESIEKLLILQDRDRKISRVNNELARIEPERHQLKSRASTRKPASTPPNCA